MSLEFARDWFEVEVGTFGRELTPAERELAWAFFRKGRECMGADWTASPGEAVTRDRRQLADTPAEASATDPRCYICGVFLSRCRCERRTGDGA